jgi:pimeloyl-ACP methyl ester carboxylesterase
VPLTESPSEGRLVDIGGTRLFVVEKSQEGYPLICLHPFARDHWTFADYLDGLAPEIRVVLPDLRGHGMSDPAGKATVSRLADDIGRLADALELDRYALLSFRDAFVVAVQHGHSGRVSHLVAVSPNADPDDRIADEALAAEYERRTAPAIPRPELAGPGGLTESGQVDVPVHVFESTAYPFVEEQDAFVERVKAFVTASG